MTDRRIGSRLGRPNKYDLERRFLSIGGLAVTVGLLAYMAVAL